MDSTCLDGIARALATDGSRRGIARATTSLIMAAGLTRLGLLRVAAGCKQAGQKCEKAKECCRGLTCKGKTCACGRGQQKCGKACCSRGEQCLSGVGGGATCCPELQVCGKKCCPPDRVCVCQLPPPFDPDPNPDDLCRCICADGYEEDRDGNCFCPFPCGDDCCEQEDGEECCSVDGDKRCVLTNSSHGHCGGCGKACASDQICVGGTCVCPPEHIDCGGKCVPKRYPDGSQGCCASSDCDGGAFCCVTPHEFTCDPHIPCGPGWHCVACL